MYLKYKKSRVYYKIKGLGSAVLFLHGWEGSVLSFKSQEDFICKKHMCINLDFPPFGKSEDIKEEYTLEDYFEIVKRILNKHNIKKISVVAHSFGCRVAILLATKTNLVEKMVFTGGAGIRPKTTIKKLFRKAKYKFYKKLARLGFVGDSTLDKFFSNDYKKLSKIMKGTFKNIVNKDLTSVLQYINVPVVLFWGRKDTETPIYMAKIMHKKMIDSCLLTYEGCGHFCYLERDFEFKQIIDKFLD